MRFLWSALVFWGYWGGVQYLCRIPLCATREMRIHLATSDLLWIQGHIEVWRLRFGTSNCRKANSNCGRAIRFLLASIYSEQRSRLQVLISPPISTVIVKVTLLIWTQSPITKILLSLKIYRWLRCEGRLPILPYSSQNWPGIWFVLVKGNKLRK